MSKKQRQSGKINEHKRRSRILTIALALATLAVALIIAYFVFFNGQGGGMQQAWHLDSAGLLAFGTRPAATANVTAVGSTANWTREEISYPGFGTEVYGLLMIPKNVARPPVVIVLPAASINKEADHAMAEALSSWGYATLTLDERGNNGKTAGPSASDVNAGYQAFASGGDPVQYKQVYDVLRGYDYLRTRTDLDGSDIAVLGESMGGRFAIIAAALEPGIKGVFTVSTGPWGLQGNSDVAAKFIKSVEPASYLSKLPQRRLVMIHFTNDSIIPIAFDRQLYDEALQPKAWHQYEGDVHGLYSDIYAQDLHDELRSALGQ